MRHGTVILLLVYALLGCTALGGMALDTFTKGSSKGGINTELVLGDKAQTFGTSQKVEATTIGKVTGISDNSITAAGAEQVNVTNNTFPVWAILLIGMLTTLIGYLAPRPQAWKRLIKRDNK